MDRSPKERFTDPNFKFYQRYANLNREMPKGKTEDGRWRCRWCWGPCSGRRTSFCCQECADEAMIRCGRGIRWYIRRRDKGICADCGVNASELRTAVRRAVLKVPWTKRYKIYRRMGISSSSEAYRSWWDADHIVPVEDGGGACGLDNYQTLCIWCHKEKSAKQKALSARRKAEEEEDWDPF